MSLNLADIFIPKKQDQGSPDFTTANEAGAGVQGAANTLLNLFGRGADIYTQVKSAGKTNVVPAGVNANLNVPVSQSASTQSSPTNFTPWIIGGVALAILVFFFARR